MAFDLDLASRRAVYGALRAFPGAARHVGPLGKRSSSEQQIAAPPKLRGQFHGANSSMFDEKEPNIEGGQGSTPPGSSFRSPMKPKVARRTSFWAPYP